MLHTKFEASQLSSSGEKDLKFILISSPRPSPQSHIEPQGHQLKKFGRGLLDKGETQPEWFNVKRETQPEWFNDDIKNAIRQRDVHHKHKHWNQYKHWRYKVNSLIRLYKKDFFSKAINENKDSAYIWKHIKNLGSQTGNSSLPDELKIGNVVYNTQEEKTLYKS